MEEMERLQFLNITHNPKYHFLNEGFGHGGGR